jgi:branched-chain amino acid transport system substrate-binding protein
MPQTRRQLVVAIGTGFLVAGCGGSATTGGGATETLTVGNLESLSGAGQSVGVPQDQAIQLAVDEINNAGGFKVGGTTYKIALDTQDDKSDPTAGVTAVQKLLTSGKINYIVGSLSSAVTSAYVPIIKDRDDIISIVVGAAVEGITDNTPIYRPRVTLSQYTSGTLNYLKQHPEFKRVAILTDNKHAGFVQQTPLLKDGMTQAGVNVVANEQYTFGATQFGPQLSAMMRATPDLINMRGYPADLARVIKQARELGYQGPILSTSGFTAKDVNDAQASPAMAGVSEVFAPLVSDLIEGNKNKDQAQKFENAYQKRYGQPSGTTSASAYDGVYILVHAMQKAGTVKDIVKVRAALDALKTTDVPELVEPIKPQSGGLIFKAHQAYFILVERQWKDGAFHPISFVG